MYINANPCKYDGNLQTASLPGVPESIKDLPKTIPTLSFEMKADGWDITPVKAVEEEGNVVRVGRFCLESG